MAPNTKFKVRQKEALAITWEKTLAYQGANYQGLLKTLFLYIHSKYLHMCVCIHTLSVNTQTPLTLTHASIHVQV